AIVRDLSPRSRDSFGTPSARLSHRGGRARRRHACREVARRPAAGGGGGAGGAGASDRRGRLRARGGEGGARAV
ncbi:MAG: hypothetical protein AVDCRST_MAG40-159, partial [uncultured Gemmatimonadaceae bacterium]